MRRRLTLALFLALAVSTVARAQVVPTLTLQWDQPEVLATVQGYSYTYTVDGGQPVLLAPACVVLTGVPGAHTRCTGPIAELPAGAHTLVLTAWGGSGSAASDPLATTPPGKPLSVSITITITIK